MKIEDILKKQGELYKNLTSNKTIQKCNETIKPKHKNELESENIEEILSTLKQGNRIFLEVEDNLGIEMTYVVGDFVCLTKEKAILSNPCEYVTVGYGKRTRIYNIGCKNTGSYLILHILGIKKFK